MKSWFSIHAKTKDRAEISIYDEIGMFGITAKQFGEQLRALGDVKTITLTINSPGGDVFDGIAIYNMLKRHPARVEVIIDGLAASIASVIAMAGDKIAMPENSHLMIHNPAGVVIGEAKNMRDMADILDKIKISLLSAYRRSGKSDQEIAEIMDAETWYTAPEAVAAGFADEVIAAVKIAAFFDLAKYQRAPAALQKPPSREPNNPDDKLEKPLTGLYLPKKEAAMLDRAAEIVDARKSETLRAEAMRHAAAIAQACAEAGHAELAAGFIERGSSQEEIRAELADPETMKLARANYAASEVSDIYKICAAVGVPDMVSDFIARGSTLEAVKDRLKYAAQIRARCLAAGRPERATAYIKANMTPEEASKNLFDILLATQSDEIDNSVPLFPNSSRSRIDYKEIYDARKPGKFGGDFIQRQRGWLSHQYVSHADELAQAIRDALKPHV